MSLAYSVPPRPSRSVYEFQFLMVNNSRMKIIKISTDTDLEARGLETTGGCLCGSVRYRVTGPLRPIIYCHCRQCRRTSGHFVAATAVAKGELYIEADENLEWFASSDSASRGFCSRCGSSLFWHSMARENISIMAGTLDESTGLEAVEHIYVKDKGDYYDLTDDLPKAPRYQ